MSVAENESRGRFRKPKVEPSSGPSPPLEPKPEPEPPGSVGLPRVSLPSVDDAGEPYVWQKPDVPGRPKRDGNCSPEQLQYYKSGGTGVFNGPSESESESESGP